MHKIFMFLLTGFFGFIACERLPMRSEALPEAAGCQGCHLSPPPTGDHIYHIFKQTRRGRITCDECHGSAVSRAHWRVSARRLARRALMPWDKLTFAGQAFSLWLPAVDTLRYGSCLVQKRGDTLFTPRSETVQAALGPDDSLAAGDKSYLYFALDSMQLRIDTLTDIFGTRYDTVRVRTFKKPVEYGFCRHRLAGGAIYRLRADFDSAARILGPLDSVVPRPELGRLYVLSPRSAGGDTLKGRLLDPVETFLGSAPPDERMEFLTILSGPAKLAVTFDTTRRQIDTAVRLFIDTTYYHLTGDTIFTLAQDSSVEFGDNLFADVTSFHMNGSVDILFSSESTTVYQEDTLGFALDSVSGVKRYNIQPRGSWAPEKAACWNRGIRAADCHNEVSGWTYWYADRGGRP